MNAAQMEVAELQGERYVSFMTGAIVQGADEWCRDEATQKSRRLQAEIVLEREKVASLMARLS